MSKGTVIKYTVRLNLENEQHMRVYRVLKDLNTAIHKSLNQFIIRAVDCYIRSFEDDGLTFEEQRKGSKETEYITKQDLMEIRRVIQSEVKDEIIRIFGAMLLSGQNNIPNEKRQDMKEEHTDQYKEDTNMIDLVSKWG